MRSQRKITTIKRWAAAVSPEKRPILKFPSTRRGRDSIPQIKGPERCGPGSVIYLPAPFLGSCWLVRCAWSNNDEPDATVNLMSHALRLFESIHQRIKRHNVEGPVDHEVNEYVARGTVIIVNEGFQSVSYALFPTCPSLSESPFFL